MSVDHDSNVLDSHGSILDLNKQDLDRASRNEIVTENDKANDKLVDLVSVLTNKINKNVKEIQVDLIDHYEDNYKKLDELENIGKERVIELIRKVEERKEANEVLKKKIHELQSKQNDLKSKFSDLENDVQRLSKDHEEFSNKMDENLESHSISLKNFETKEQEINERLTNQLNNLNLELKDTFTTIEEKADVVKNELNEKISNNNDHALQRQAKTEKEFKFCFE